MLLQSPDEVKILQEMKASPNVCSIEEVKMYPLHLAIQHANHECFLALIEHEKVSNASARY